MPRGIPRTPRAVKTPGEPLAPVAESEHPAVEPEQEQAAEPSTEVVGTDTAQDIANRTGRPQLCPREGWVLPQSVQVNLERAGGR